jgi:hypothetical protein
MDVFSQSFGSAMMRVQNMAENSVVLPVYVIEIDLLPTMCITEIVIEKSAGTF